jgi:hypothetical protein
MNSISRFLNAESIAATARMLRSAKREILLIVEGDDDIALFSHSLGLPRSNFISCAGKERLMEVFDLAPRAGLDAGTIFIRDADFDDVGFQEKDGVILLTSDRYDFEMSLLPPRIFSRIFMEYLKTKATPQLSQDAFQKILGTSSFIGAMRLASHNNGLNLDFKNSKLNFIDHATLEVDLMKMAKYFLSKSGVSLEDSNKVVDLVKSEIDKGLDPEELCSGKDFLRVLSLALSKHYKCCNSTECTFETLARMFRVTVMHDDVRKLAIYDPLVEQVDKSGMAWTGNAL